MCGLVGFIDYHKTSSLNVLKDMTDVLHHRGPNDSGYSFFDNENMNIGLGHRRLSILDLSSYGHQPMVYQNLEIVYNGEVYNFKEIRKELKKHHYSFESDSDTEVILKAYHKWGIKAVDRFNGMFAISIYDKENEKIILIRDRAGVKPLYWYWENDTLLFASELKSFHEFPSFKKEINTSSLSLYLQHGYILQPHTIFKNTYKLKSGHFLEIDLSSKNIEEKKYWDVFDCYNKPKLSISKEEAVRALDDLLQSSFNYRMVSDVPVGVFLSGGYDSSAVAAIIQSQSKSKLKTFTIGFHEQGFNEAPYAKKVANHLSTEHTEYYCTQKEAADIIPSLAEIYDEPFADASAIPTILVSKIAKNDVTVALSADGGDEAFAGYGKYVRSMKYLNILQKNHIIKKLLKIGLPVAIEMNVLGTNRQKQLERIVETLKKKDTESILKLMRYWNENAIDKLLIDKTSSLHTYFDTENFILGSNDDINKMLAIDYKTYMVDDVLTKVDRATMSVSLEGREPLLDYRIIEFAAQLPSSYKLNLGNTKDILKNVVHKYIPKELMERPKMGFGVPLEHWFKDELKELIDYYLDKNRLLKENIFNTVEVENLKKEYFRNPTGNDTAQSIWKILMFEMWYERWMS